MLVPHGRNPWRRLPDGPLVAPSLLSCDFARTGEDIDAVLSAGARLLHVDIMDGHFVPNLSMGPGFVRKIRRFTPAPLDVHLMLTDPGYFIDKFAEAGADSITFHMEACGRPRGAAVRTARGHIRRLRSLGLGAGITIRPKTPLGTIEDVIGDVDLVLVMTVEPGYGGQDFIGTMAGRIAEVKGMLRSGQRLEVDGGINPVTAAQCVRLGADVLVAGANVFENGPIGTAFKRLASAARSGRASRSR